MYFEPIDCTVEEAEENKKEQIKMLKQLWQELRPLYKRQAELECCAANREREIIYWDTQANWARKEVSK